MPKSALEKEMNTRAAARWLCGLLNNNWATQSSLLWQADSTEKQKFATSAGVHTDENSHCFLLVPEYLPPHKDRQPSSWMTACFNAHIY